MSTALQIVLGLVAVVVLLCVASITSDLDTIAKAQAIRAARDAQLDRDLAAMTDGAAVDPDSASGS